MNIETCTLKAYKNHARRVLKHMCIWTKMTTDEQDKLYACKTDVAIDNYKRNLIKKYL